MTVDAPHENFGSGRAKLTDMLSDEGKAALKLRHLLIVLLPTAVFLINNLVLRAWAMPLDALPPRIAEFDAFAEGAARFGTLATFMLSVGASGGVLIFFFYTLGMLRWRDRLMMAAGLVVLTASAAAIEGRTHGRSAQEYAGRALVCLANSYTEDQSDSARRQELQAAEAEAARRRAASPGQQGQPPPVTIPAGVDVQLLPHQDCKPDWIERLYQIERWQAFAVAYAFAALVLGALCCLARPERFRSIEPSKREPVAAAAPGEMEAKTSSSNAAAEAEPAALLPAPDPELEYWERQSSWLNTYLYLGALLLGTTLMFISALLRWPGFVLLQQPSYDAYVAALVADYGFTFTLMLGAFYIPIATILSQRVKELSRTHASGAKLPEAFQGPLQLLKIVLGLFSTAFAGAVPAVIALIA